MNRLNVQENEDKHVRNIALKDAGLKNCQDSSDDSDGETLSLLSKKFNKFLKKNSNKNHSPNRYNSKKLNDFNSNKYTCFGYGEKGHIKVDCPNNESKERVTSKKGEKKDKAKRAWQDNEVSSSNSSSGDEKANLCLMAKGESDMSSVSSSNSNNFENYSQLLHAFKETYEEANRLALLNNQLKDLNNWLENKVKTLEEELENSKNDFENLELIYRSLLTNVTQVFVKIVNLLKRRFTIL